MTEKQHQFLNEMLQSPLVRCRFVAEEFADWFARKDSGTLLGQMRFVQQIQERNGGGVFNKNGPLFDPEVDSFRRILSVVACESNIVRRFRNIV